MIYGFVKREWKSINQTVFINLVVDPLKWFLFILITVFAFDKLYFPRVLKFEIYGHQTNEIISRFGTGIIIISFTWLILRLINFIAVVLAEKAAHTSDGRDSQLIIFLRDFLKVIVALCGLLLIIKACFNQHIGNLLTGLSLVGAALALAAKESLENLIASFIIFFDKPFYTGDIVNVNNITGNIEKIGLRSTRIRTGDKTLVTVPNKQMVDTIVDNWSMRTNRRAVITLELSSKNQLAVIESFIELLKKMLASKTEHITSSTVFLNEINKSGLIITIEFFTEPFSLNEFNELKQVINLSVIKLMEDNKIEIVSDSTTVVLTTENK
ncbi:MAG: mechanosensitive ion channel domain-containing protein [Ferruginibacter sp.]